MNSSPKARWFDGTTFPGPVPRRAGAALVLVMMVLSLGVVLSFALLQAQTTHMFLQRNANHLDRARQLALSGVSAALQQMRDPQWAGVDTGFQRTVGTGQSFHVSYTAGDPQLTPGDADYWLWPYRVTVTVTGRSEDPANPQIASEHTIRLVVQLVPEQLAPVPAAWTTSLQYALFQRYRSSGQDAVVEVPCQVQGRSRFQKQLKYMNSYPLPDQAAQRLAADWHLIYQAQQGEYRTFTGEVELPLNKQSGRTLQALQALGVPVTDKAKNSSEDWPLKRAIFSYRLYPGGPVFQAEQLPASLQDTVLEPDPTTNPLGLYYRMGSIELGEDVEIHGTVLTYTFWNGSLRLNGTNILIEPVSMLPLQGENKPVQLPAVILLQHLKVEEDCSAEIRGAVYVSDRLRVYKDSQADISLQIQGPVSMERLDIQARDEWDQGAQWWDATWQEFQQSGDPLFALWLLQNKGLDSTPRIVLSGPSDQVRYHWPDARYPIYVHPSEEEGLQWDLVRWEETGP